MNKEIKTPKGTGGKKGVLEKNIGPTGVLQST